MVFFSFVVVMMTYAVNHLSCSIYEIQRDVKLLRVTAFDEDSDMSDDPDTDSPTESDTDSQDEEDTPVVQEQVQEEEVTVTTDDRQSNGSCVLT